ncbi:uncharacterized protein [Chelonus insularis]|uniref:uncharacterized protein n=1 Tax=Chelonus insularis TaxID=460826 RepID=UPI0015891C6A|nr:uncharacterized protein LOC118074245 [Chelonus insularis]
MLENEFENEVTRLHSEGKFKEIIALSESVECYKAQRLLWVWPTFNDLNWIKEIIIDYNLHGIMSIGCGTGLLEWIIQQYLNCDVIGVEADQCWWSSKYSPPCFLSKIIFCDRKNPSVNIPTNYAILFCYFNNGQAFENYLKIYQGNVILIIGPNEGQNRYTDPLPFDVKFDKLGWKLSRMRKLDNNTDCITVYTR